MLTVKVKKTHPDARLPRYATDGSGAFDLFATVLEDTTATSARAVFDTGLAFEIPEGHVMLVFSRSGHGFRHGIRLVNSVGVIDSDYRGSVKVALRRDKNAPNVDFRWDGVVARNTAVAQALVLPLPQVTFEEAEELTCTERGTGGFGSTDQPTMIPPGAMRGLMNLDATGGKLACPKCGNEHRVVQVSENVGHCHSCNTSSPLSDCVLKRVCSSGTDFFIWPNGLTLPRSARDSRAFQLALAESDNYRVVAVNTNAFDELTEEESRNGDE